MTKDDSQNSATKEDVQKIVGDAVNLIFERFDLQDADIADKADKADITRLENKLDSTIDKVDDHGTRIKKLEPATAA